MQCTHSCKCLELHQHIWSQNGVCSPYGTFESVRLCPKQSSWEELLLKLLLADIFVLLSKLLLADIFVLLSKLLFADIFVLFGEVKMGQMLRKQAPAVHKNYTKKTM